MTIQPTRCVHKRIPCARVCHCLENLGLFVSPRGLNRSAMTFWFFATPRKTFKSATSHENRYTCMYLFYSIIYIIICSIGIYSNDLHYVPLMYEKVTTLKKCYSQRHLHISDSILCDLIHSIHCAHPPLNRKWNRPATRLLLGSPHRKARVEFKVCS